MAVIKSIFAQLALLAAIITPAMAQNWVGTELSQVISEQAVLFTECTSYISTCQPTLSVCASNICAECTGLGAKPINSCCAQADPVSCFIAYKAGAAASTTAASGAATLTGTASSGATAYSQETGVASTTSNAFATTATGGVGGSSSTATAITTSAPSVLTVTASPAASSQANLAAKQQVLRALEYAAVLPAVVAALV